MMHNGSLYTDMARSLAPGVCGAEDIKKAVLLMLLGGVHKQTPEVCLSAHQSNDAPPIKSMDQNQKGPSTNIHDDHVYCGFELPSAP